MGALATLLLGDGRLPVGGHTYSAGLEPAAAAGLTRDRVPALLRARLSTTAATE
ncbi:urease accessory protein, partial [Streptomyces albidoflavus]|nr:urease accessory protein [Streptomyces albidoflavus]